MRSLGYWIQLIRNISTLTMQPILYASWFVRNIDKTNLKTAPADFISFLGFFLIGNNSSWVKFSIDFASSTQKPLVLKPKHF